MVEQNAEASTSKFSTELENIDGLLSPEMEINLYRILHPHGDMEQRIMVLTYSASDPSDLQRPSRAYVDHLLRGARRWGLPADYIARLERIEVVE